MPKVDVWMPWYIADYQSDTSHLNPPQDSAYRRMLEHQWKTRRPLPNDIHALINITKMSPFFVDASSIPQACVEHASSIGRASASKDERMLYAWLLDLLNQFFVQNQDGSWSQLRLEAELRKWGARSEAAVEKARRAAWKRWHPGVPFPEHAPSIPQAEPEQSPSSSPGKNKYKYQRDLSVAARKRGKARVHTPARSASTIPNQTPSKIATSASKNPAAVPSGAPLPTNRATVPKKLVAGDVSEVVRPPKSRPDPDPRFGAFQEEIFKYWAGVNQDLIGAGLIVSKPPWGTRERVELSRWLTENPEAKLSMLQAFLLHRINSDRVNHGDPPYRWIRDLTSYGTGSLDQFRRPRVRRSV